MNARATLLLSRGDVEALLPPEAALEAVEDAFLDERRGRALPAVLVSVAGPGGVVHVKAAGLLGARPVIAAKLNANYPGNPTARGLPTIQGVVALVDAVDGRLLALLDSMSVTALRTAAVTAAAARILARRDSTALALWGCGFQARAHVAALSRIFRLEQIHAIDADPAAAARFAVEIRDALGIRVHAGTPPREALRESRLCVTCTTAHSPLFDADDVLPGTFIAAIGSDAPEKQEIDPRLFSRAVVVADHLEQCAAIGEIHHGIAAGVIGRDDVRGELAEILAGEKPGRESDEEIFVFDSTGTALADVAAAWRAYENARRRPAGADFDFGSRDPTCPP